MSKRQILAAMGVLLGLLGLTAGLSTAQGSAGEPTVAEGDLSLAATVDSTISYQGMLTDNGNPVSGSRTMTFRLFSDSGCTTQVGADINAGTVPVSEGYFDVDLPVDHGDFDGQALWVEVEVSGTDIGCEPIRPVPYALGLKPGASISAASIGSSGSILEAKFGDSLAGSLSKSLLFGGAGVYGYSDFDTLASVGVYGVSEGDTSLSYGVWGSSSSSGGRGVYGEATRNSGTNYGVYGKTSSPDGYGGYFDGDVGQGGTDDGLVKAGALVYCSNLSSTVNYFFNNVGDSVTVASGGESGRCTVDFDFDLTNRYWSATSAGSGTTNIGVSCSAPSGLDDQMQCQRWLSNGTRFDGLIMVVVY